MKTHVSIALTKTIGSLLILQTAIIKNTLNG